MNRTRRSVAPKPFVSGGTYNPNVPKPVIQMPEAVAPSSVPSVPAVQPQPAQSLTPLPAQGQEKFAVVGGSLPIPMIIKNEPMSTDGDPGEGEGEGEGENNRDSFLIDLSEENGNGGRIPFKKIFQKRKKSSERTRDKKLRQNRQLRKSMLPKNALMALNEVKGITISDFTINSNSDGGFTAIVTVNSNQYEGKGNSKMAAKNFACEKALRDYIIAKMTRKARKVKPASNQSESMDTTDNEEGGKEGGENEEEGPDDDLPMLNLASFAIYKLFAEWEREGYVVPDMHPSAGATANQAGDANAAPPTPPKEPKKPPIRTELPSNWETMHPATLLCIMRPRITYVDYGCSGEKPNVVQRLGVIVDEQEFTANGRSKKIARRNVAVNVCNSLFGTNFAYEEY